MDDRWSVVLRMGLLFGTKQQGESDDSLHQPKESSSVMKRDGRSKVQTERVGVGGGFPFQAPPSTSTPAPFERGGARDL